MKPNERRRYPRLQVAVQIELHFEGGGAPLRTETIDLSANGCFVGTIFPQPIGSKVEIIMWLDELQIIATGAVVTCTPQVGNGIEFLSISSADRELLAAFLEAAQAEQPNCKGSCATLPGGFMV